MLVVDDILLSPVKSVLWIFREIYNATQEEFRSQGEAITQELSELYMKLETGRITEEEFDNRESELLDRLEAFNKRQAGEIEEEDEA